MNTGPLVIIGASCAGVSMAIAARELGFEQRILLLGEEADLPYHRPPLSKAYLAGKVSEGGLALRPAALFSSLGIELLSETRVAAIDRSGKAVRTLAGERIPYGRLALTTGCRPRTLSCPGATSENVLMLRTLADARRLRAAAATSAEIVIVGGGFIGLEVAASLAMSGASVTVVEVEQQLLAHSISRYASDALMHLHRARGVNLRLGVKVTEIDSASDRARAVRLSDGSVLPCDLAIAGIGSIPNDELASAAGLLCRDGVMVDQFGNTSDPAICASGDCARHPNPFAGGRHIRLESVQNATDQARSAAASLAGKPEPYAKVPWFWSDQFDLKLQIAGLVPASGTKVIRGELDSGRFSVFHFNAGRLVGVESLGRPTDHLFARRCLAQDLVIAPEILTDTSIDPLQAASAGKATAPVGTENHKPPKPELAPARTSLDQA